MLRGPWPRTKIGCVHTQRLIDNINSKPVCRKTEIYKLKNVNIFSMFNLFSGCTNFVQAARHLQRIKYIRAHYIWLQVCIYHQSSGPLAISILLIVIKYRINSGVTYDLKGTPRVNVLRPALSSLNSWISITWLYVLWPTCRFH